MSNLVQVTVKSLEEFRAQEAAYAAFMEEYLEGNGTSDGDEFEYLVNNLQECAGDSKESIDYNYIHTTYTSDFGRYQLSVIGSAYRKDQSVCDEQLEMAITITDLKAKKLLKQVLAAASKLENMAKWSEYVHSHSSAELLNLLADVKFPTKK